MRAARASPPPRGISHRPPRSPHTHYAFVPARGAERLAARTAGGAAHSVRHPFLRSRPRETAQAYCYTLTQTGCMHSGVLVPRTARAPGTGFGDPGELRDELMLSERDLGWIDAYEAGREHSPRVIRLGSPHAAPLDLSAGLLGPRRGPQKFSKPMSGEESGERVLHTSSIGKQLARWTPRAADRLARHNSCAAAKIGEDRRRLQAAGILPRERRKAMRRAACSQCGGRSIPVRLATGPRSSCSLRWLIRGEQRGGGRHLRWHLRAATIGCPGRSSSACRWAQL